MSLVLPNGFKLRGYQTQAVNSVWNEWDRGVQSTLCVSATGTGKSCVVAGIAGRMPEDSKFLYIVHRDSLAKQAVRQFQTWTNRSVQMEMQQFGKGRTHNGKAQIIVAGVQSLNGRKKKYDIDEFDYVGTDESHRYAGNTWADTVRHFRAKHRLGNTATPNRHDGVQLIGPDCEFQSVAFEYPIDVAIKDGYIVPFKWRVESSRDIDLDSITEITSGDLSPSAVEREMTKAQVVRHIVRTMIRVADGRQGIVFCKGVQQVYAVHAEFKRQGASSIAVTGKTHKGVRYYQDQDFKASRVQFSVGCEVHIEGYDHPGIEVIGNAAPTLSWTKCVQMNGRGSRTIGEPIGATPEERRLWIANSEKPLATLIDFVGNSKRHNLMLGVNVLGGTFTREEMEESVRLVADSGQEFDIEEISAQAKANVAARPKLKAGEGYEFKDRAAEKKFTFEHYADPFTVLGLNKSLPSMVVPEEDTYGRSFRVAREFLVESKLFETEIQEMCQYSIVYLRDELVRRANAGLCSYPQARRLHNLGYDCASMRASTAKFILTASKAEGHVRPACDGPNMRFLNR